MASPLETPLAIASSRIHMSRDSLSAMRVAPHGAHFADDMDAVMERTAKTAAVTHAHAEAAA
jgi:ADP-ribosylglycohydrolase